MDGVRKCVLGADVICVGAYFIFYRMHCNISTVCCQNVFLVVAFFLDLLQVDKMHLSCLFKDMFCKEFS
jgi:hypothetical protein